MLIYYLIICALKFAKGEPNFVLILTDDQDLLLNGMVPMTKTVQLVANNGKTFQNAYVNTPLCCPSRSTILTGQYIHNTGVSNNSLEGNCSSAAWQENLEPFSIASLLKKNKNYVNFYAGKYMNQYGSEAAGGLHHVPEGYDWWIGLKGNSKYYNYTLSINGTSRHFSGDYLTDVLARYSLNFLDNKPGNRPFFMTIATPAPHAPFTPAERHKNVFKNATAPRTPSFNHSSSNKHWLVHMPPEFLPTDARILDNVQQLRLESLLAVDELVDKVVEKLKSLSLFEDTYVIYMSDNGFHIGQFGQPWDKRQPYETDLRIPLIISGPNISKKSLEEFPVSAADIAPTVLDIAGVPIPANIDGRSFKERLFSSRKKLYNERIFIEYRGEANAKSIDDDCPWKYDKHLSECSVQQWCKCQDSRNNTYACVLELSDVGKFKFCEFYDEKHTYEAYDLITDPYELNNVVNDLNSTSLMSYKGIMRKFRTCTGRNCRKISRKSSL
ncbi:unnamed protein product [Phyllotreta striolata]|uniref:Sulfatase N-terminal domain-containing protein n=1 Tax=Phyllotreta striolata TaxID=444603 RepID=A0A9N9TWR3_PHYSR|nr:unnamed protein product [Phyllotreta striolata]